MLSAGVAVLALTPSGWAQSASHWRVFKAADGLPEAACLAVTVGAQGTVLTRHLKAARITRLDGYEVSQMAAPAWGTGRVVESPSGQLWALSHEGLCEFRDGEWTLHPVPAVAAALRAAGSARAELPFLSVRHGQVLLVLNDRLLCWSSDVAGRQETEVLRRAAETPLGALLGITTARDGGLWLSGERGLAKLPPPARALRADTAWQVHEVPAALEVRNLRNPLADPAGGVTMVADTRSGAETVAVHFDGQQWSVWSIGAEGLRFAWLDAQQTAWAATTNALLVRHPDTGEFALVDELPARRFFDVAVEPGGAFWLATLDGLYRYTPPAWQTPPAARPVRAPVLAMAADDAGGVWFVAEGTLQYLRSQQRQVLAFPEALRRRLQTVRALHVLPGGLLLLQTDTALFQFDPARRAVEPWPSDEPGGATRCLGVLADGRAILATFDPQGPATEVRLQVHDGRQLQPWAATTPLPSAACPPLAFLEARNGDAWLSGEQGVARQRGGHWQSFPAEGQRAPAAARHFAEGADGRIWAATADEVWAFDGRDWSPVRSGFQNIHAIRVTRDSTLWVATDKGLHRLTAGGWLENSIEEGLPDANIRCLCEDRRGWLWAGTAQGLSLYNRDADTEPPRTEIVTHGGRRLPEGSLVMFTLQGRDKWNVTPPGRLLYSHRLDDHDWSPFQDVPTVAFAELPSGPHTFQARVMDRNGNIDARPAQLAFELALPWYKERRLVLVAAAGMLGVLFFAALAVNRHLRLRRSYAEVERQVTERTRQLEQANQELLHIQKMKALGTLAAGLAHDFNSILSIIQGSAQIIEDNLDNPEKIRTRVDRIKTVVAQGAGIVQAMLGYTRASDEATGPCDLNAVTRETVALLGERFLREVAVEFEPAPDLPLVSVPRGFVQQILLNFIFNAAEAMSNPKQVRLSTRRWQPDGAHVVLPPAAAHDYVAVSVRDSGCGIPPENLSRIFEPFFTTKALSKRRGTGLGLSMVYELARRMNAGLTVQSEVGRGSVFTLVLPVQTTTP